MDKEKIVELLKYDMAAIFYLSEEGKNTIGVFPGHVARAIVEAIENIGVPETRLPGQSFDDSMDTLKFLVKENADRKAGRIPRG